MMWAVYCVYAVFAFAKPSVCIPPKAPPSASDKPRTPTGQPSPVPQGQGNTFPPGPRPPHHQGPVYYPPSSGPHAQGYPGYLPQGPPQTPAVHVYYPSPFPGPHGPQLPFSQMAHSYPPGGNPYYPVPYPGPQYPGSRPQLPQGAQGQAFGGPRPLSLLEQPVQQLCPEYCKPGQLAGEHCGKHPSCRCAVSLPFGSLQRLRCIFIPKGRQ
uniref:Putative basic proline-rich protein n=1 Tax=Amblyomma triste TaxID=251400 RepID=A0A023G2X5_AMBTT